MLANIIRNAKKTGIGSGGGGIVTDPYGSLPVSGAALWLAGNDSSTLYTDAGSNAVSQSGDLIYQWNDKSGNSRNAIQATSGSRPTWVTHANARNNYGAVAFSGNKKMDSSTSAFSFGTSNFTFECWFKVNVFPPTSGQTYSQFAGQVTSSTTMGFGVVWTGSRYSIMATTFTVAYFGSTSLSASTWYHAAFVRQSGTLKLYLNGILDGTYTVSTSISSTAWSVGANTASNFYFNGHLQYIAVYNGQALYTANFTPWMS